ncbi:MAG: UDP-3-O-acyl-N-acetylglucosamine deacetylase [Candidatus Gracilibacteria bacterium]
MSFQTVTELGEESIVENPVIFRGQGLHTGESSVVSVENNPNEDGIFFERDGARAKLIPDRVNNTGRTTSLTNDGGEVVAMTIEHILSAFYALRIRNANLVLQEGIEIPILDGTSDVFLRGIDSVRRRIQKQVGAVTLDVPFMIHDESDDKRFVRLDMGTGEGVDIRSCVQYPDSPIAQQQYDFRYGDFEDYRREIALARTSYPFYLRTDEDVERLFQRLKGIRYKGPDQNVNIVDPRYNTGDSMPNNVPRHKILDFLGDMQVLNLPLANGVKVTLNNAGHRLNNQLVRSIYSNVSHD